MLLRRGLLMATLLAGAWALGGAPEAPPQDPAELPTHLIKVLRTTNKAQTNRYVPKVYTLNNVNPYSLLRWIRRTAQIEEGGFYFFGKPQTEGDRESVNSGKVVVIVPEYMVPGLDRLMATIDREGLTSSSGEKFFYFRPRHRHVEDTGFTDLVKALRGNSGDAEADEEANMFLVYAAPSKIRDLQKYLPLFDVRPPQVMVEVTLYEVTVDNESKIGLDYVAWKNGPGRNLFAAGLFAEREYIIEQQGADPLHNTGTGGTFGLPGHGFRAKGSNAAWFLDVPSAFFDYLVVKGKARVMTSAKLATRNLVPAALAAGDTILYYHSRTGSIPDGGVRAAGRPVDPRGEDGDFPDNRSVVGTQADRELTGDLAGVGLAITPIIAENEIDLEIEVGLVSHTGFDDEGVPQLSEREVVSHVRLRDGQEVVLGGYSRQVFVQRADRMPFLGKLPLLGYAFGGEGNTTERRQLVLVLSPHVIQDASAMAYEGTTIDAALIKAKARREAPVEVPRTTVGFDQWLLDTGK
ncbi:MAG: type II secretion system protein GspD [Candidatus Brocadiia bacterium]